MLMMALLAGPGAAVATTTPAATQGGSGRANLTLWSINSDGDYFQVILSGSIGDYGAAQTVLPNGKDDPTHMHDMKLELQRGSFLIQIEPITADLTKEAAGEPIYKGTCSDYFQNMTATLPVVSGSGTGAYKGISGSFSMSLIGNEDQKATPCTAPSARQILFIYGSGRVSW